MKITNCPVCGSKVKTGAGDGNSHYYISVEERYLIGEGEIKQLQNQVYRDEITFGKMIEILNEKHINP